MCDEAVNVFLPTLNFVPHCLVTNKMVKKLSTALYSDENILYFDGDFINVVFNCNEMGILNINVNFINLDDNNFDEHDPDTTVHVRLLAWQTKFKKRKAFKKDISEESMAVA